MSTLRVNNVTNVAGGATYAPGHVVQVQSSSMSTQFTTTSTTFVDVPGLSASITPKSNTSKILATYTAYTNAQVQGNETYVSLFRGSTNLNTVNPNSGFGGLFSQSGGWTAVCVAGSVLDSPASTATLTYSIRFRVQGGTGNFNPAGQLATLTLMEVAA